MPLPQSALSDHLAGAAQRDLLAEAQHLRRLREAALAHDASPGIAAPLRRILGAALIAVVARLRGATVAKAIKTTGVVERSGEGF